MKALVLIFGLAVSVQASAQTTQRYLADRFAENPAARAVVESFASAQAFEPAPVACDYLNLKVISVKGELHTLSFEAEITCKPVSSGTSTEDVSVIRFKGSVEDSQIFPSRVEIQ